MIDLETLKNNNIKLSNHLDSIKADVTAQGGVVFGQHTFTSELQVLQVAMLECPQGDKVMRLACLSTQSQSSVMTPCVCPAGTGRRTQRPWRSPGSCQRPIERLLLCTI